MVHKLKRIQDRFFTGDIKLWRLTLPRAVVVGLLGVVFLYVSSAGLVSVTTPWWLGSGDAPRHVDYALSIYHFDIPHFNDHLQYPVFNQLAQGSYRNQPAAVNPPLFYILHAPIVGPMMDSGHWHEAIGAGRAFNVFLGVLCILVLAWAGWLIGGSRRGVLAVAVPAISVLFFNFIVLNQNYAVDVLLIIFTTLSFIISFKLLTNGVRRKYILWLAVISLLGMSTKATYIVFLFTSLVALVAAYYLHGKSKAVVNIVRGGLVATAIFVAVLLTIGWYYYFQNYRVSGNWVSAAPPDFGSATRPYKSLHQVITSSVLWQMFYARFISNPILSTVMSTVAITGLAVYFDRNRLREVVRNRTLMIFIGLMLLAVLGIFATQIVMATGYGGYYFRYFLPVILPFGLFLAFGLTQIKWLRGQLITLFCFTMLVTGVTSALAGSSMLKQVPQLKKTGDTTARIYIATEHNNIPGYISTTLIAMAPVGLLALGVSMYKLTNDDIRFTK